MLAAISTTILSNRSWALTCSAMVSRSRLSKTRGPPDALRMCWYPPPRSQQAGWPAAGVKLKKNNNFIHSARRKHWKPGRIRIAKIVAQFAAAHPSGRIANWGLFCQAKRLPQAITALPAQRRRHQGKIVLNLIESIKRVQRAHPDLGIDGVNQHRKPEFG